MLTQEILEIKNNNPTNNTLSSTINEIGNSVDTILMNPKTLNEIESFFTNKHISNLLENVKSYDEQYHMIIANKLIDNGYVGILIKNLISFDSKYHNKLIYELIKKGYLEEIKSNISYYYNDENGKIELNKTLALKLINDNNFEALNILLYFFHGFLFDESIGFQLIEQGYLKEIYYCINKFKDNGFHNICFIKMLIEYCNLNYNDFNLNDIKNIDYNKIINLFIEKGKGYNIASFLHELKNIDYNTQAGLLIGKGYGRCIISELGKYNNGDFNNKTLFKLIDETLKKYPIIHDNDFYLSNNYVYYKEDSTTKFYLYEIIKNIDKFKNIDSNELISIYIYYGECDYILKYIDKFKGVNYEEIIDILKLLGKEEIIIKYIDKFKSVNTTNLINELIDDGYGIYILPKINKLKGINHEKLSKKVFKEEFDNGFGDDVIANINSFKGIDQNQVIDRSIEAGLFEELAHHVDKFEINLHQKIADVLTKAGEIEYIRKNMEKFSNVIFDKSIVLKIVPQGINNGGRDIVTNLHKFKKEDYKYIIDRFKETGNFHFVISHFEKFEGILFDIEFAKDLIKDGKGFNIGKNIKLFKEEEHNKIADLLIETDYIHDFGKKNFYHLNSLAIYLLDFKGIDIVKIANKIIGNGKGVVLISHPENFTFIDYDALLDKIYDDEFIKTYLYEFAKNINKIKIINHDKTAEKIISKGYGNFVIKYFHNFNFKNNDKVIDKLIKNGNGKDIAINLKKFNHINYSELILKLIGLGYIDILKNTIKEINNIYYNKLALNLIRTGNYNKIIYLELFNQLDNKGQEYIDIINQITGINLIDLLGDDINLFINLSNYYKSYILEYLTNSNNNSINNFKLTFSNLKNHDSKKYLLKSFYACSQNPEIGDKIIELADKPGSEKLFKNYSELVNLQSEEGFGDFLKILLSRGEGMLLNAYDNKSDDQLEIEDKHLSKLVKTGLKMKQIYKGQNEGNIVSIDEFNEADMGVKLNLVQGGNLLKETDSISMMYDDNYLDTKKFPKKHFKAIFGWIKEAHEDGDKCFLNFALEYMGKDFNNPNSNFLFLEDDSGYLMGVCKIEKRKDGSYYYGTHYLREDVRGDFSLGIMLQKILENEISKGEEIHGATIISNIDILIRQIEFSGGIGEEIITYKDGKYESKPFLGFSINTNKNYITKNIELKTKNDFEKISGTNIKIEVYSEDNFSQISEGLFNDGFNITRIIKENNEVIVIYERLAVKSKYIV